MDILPMQDIPQLKAIILISKFNPMASSEMEASQEPALPGPVSGMIITVDKNPHLIATLLEFTARVPSSGVNSPPEES